MDIGSLAPEYLSIPGYQDCLGIYNPSPSYKAKCLPKYRPSKCVNSVWKEIQSVFIGENCPEIGTEENFDTTLLDMINPLFNSEPDYSEPFEIYPKLSTPNIIAAANVQQVKILGQSLGNGCLDG